MPTGISAYNQAEEWWRFERLQDVIANIDHATRKHVLALHDHKGCLYVNFDQHPFTGDVLAVAMAWASQDQERINFYVQGNPLIWDTSGENPFGGPPT